MRYFSEDTVESKLGVRFKHPRLLREAFTHSSYANEHKCPSNERLEFLGDSVLSIIITDYIFTNIRANEGDLSKIRASLVSEKTLSYIFESLGLEEFLLKGEGLRKNKATKAMMADALEAIIAATYLDGGMEKARVFVLGIFGSTLSTIAQDGVPNSSKSALQEQLTGVPITYSTTAVGEGVDKIYRSRVFVNGVMSGTGEGKKKKDAEENAAKEALTVIKRV